MIESNNEKTFVYVFTLLMENYVNMNFFGEKSKNQDKLIQSVRRDSIPKTGTVPAKPGLLEYLKPDLSYLDKLHLVEERNFILAKSIYISVKNCYGFQNNQLKSF